MKEITLFYLETCPHCVKARKYMQELCEENPSFAKIPVKMIEETKEKELADSYDYYYVPCFYIGKEKIAEGTISREGVKEVFNKALAE